MEEVRPGVWRLRVYLGRRARTDTPVHANRTFRGTEKQASRALARFVADVDADRFDRTKATVGQLLDRWLATIETVRKPSTVRDYRGAIEHTIRPAIGNTRLAALRADELDAWYRHWLTEEVSPGRRRSPTTVVKYHHIIAAACAQAVKWGWIERNPAKLTTPPRAVNAEMVIPTPEALQEILSRAEAKRPVLGTAVALAALTGLRRGELCALRWTDVGTDRLSVSRSLTVLKRELVLGDTKTHARRVLALDALALEVLGRRRQEAERVAELADVALDPHGFVLSERADSARPILPDTLTHWFGDLMVEMGLPFHLHHLRHFMVTTALAAGVDVRTVAGRSGHKDSSLMLRVYAHAVETQDRRAAEALGKALKPKRARARKAIGSGATVKA